MDIDGLGEEGKVLVKALSALGVSKGDVDCVLRIRSTDDETHIWVSAGVGVLVATHTMGHPDEGRRTNVKIQEWVTWPDVQVGNPKVVTTWDEDLRRYVTDLKVTFSNPASTKDLSATLGMDRGDEDGLGQFVQAVIRRRARFPRPSNAPA
jgi:hypothetical protein